MKKTLTLIASLMLAMAIPHSVKAYDFYAVASNGDTLYYNIVDGATVMLTNPGWFNGGYTKPSGVLVIPSTVTHGGITYSVTSIGVDALSTCADLTSVTIPNTVTSIGEHAFKLCTGLTSVDIPNSVTTLGFQAFERCTSLTTVTIPSSVDSAGQSVFWDCTGLTSVVYNAESCSTNGTWFINDTNITSFTFGNNVKMIPSRLCYGLSGLTSVTIPDSVTSVGENAFQYCSGLVSLTYNADSCVSACYIEGPISNVTFGDNVKVIPNSLCYNKDNLKTVTIPASVIYIGSNAFANCDSLDSIIMLPVVAPEKHTSFGNPTYSHPTTFYIPCGSYDSYYSNGYYNYYNTYVLKEPEVDFAITVQSDDTVNGNVQVVQQHGADVTCDSTAVIWADCSGLTLFNRWSNGSTANPDTLHLTHDTAVTAHFVHLTLNKNIESDNVFCNVNYNKLGNSVVEISAYAHYALGYEFDHWSNGSTANPDTVTLTSDSTITAIFVRSQRTVTASVNDSDLGSVVFPDGNTAFVYDTLMVVAVPEAHCHVVDWVTGSGLWSIVSMSAQKDTVWLHASYYNGTVTCNFAIDTHTVVATPCNDSLGTVEGGGEYAYGSTCTLQASPADGYVFSGWSNGETANPYVFQVVEDVELTALFVMETFNVTVTSADPTMGSASVNGHPEASVTRGEAVVLTATANEGYRFTHWNDGDTNATRAVIVTCDTAFIAYFEMTPIAETYTVTVSVNDPAMGSATVNGEASATVENGEAVVLTATANEGYRFTHWSDGDTNAMRAVIVTCDTAFTAYFEANGGTEGIGDVAGNGIRVYALNGRIAVEGAENETVTVFDMTGRTVHNANLPAGVYMIKVGIRPARKVVVIR